jgi:hypothetical protein
MVVIGCVCGIAVGLAIAFLAGMHAYHIMRNMTTIEMHTLHNKVRLLHFIP